MAAPSGFTLRNVNNADIPTPVTGKFTVFGSADLPRVKNDAGVVTVLGNGIASITEVGTVGLVTTYRITLQDGGTFDFDVTDGRSIVSITKIGTVGLVDTYRIAFNDGPAFDYTVTNARSIVDIIPPANPGQPGATDTYTIDFNDGPNDSFIVYNGIDGTGVPANAPPPAVAATSSVGTTTAEYALEDHTHQGVTSVAVNGGAATSGPISLTIPVAPNAAPPAVAAASSAGTNSGEYANENHTHAGVTSVSVNGGAATQGAVSLTIPTAANAAPPAVAATSSTGTTTGEYALEDHTHAGVTSFNGRQGAVTPQQADYDAFFTTPAEAGTIAAAEVDAHEALADPHPQYTTAAEASAAAPVQSVNGQTGNVTVAAGTDNTAVTREAPTASSNSATPVTLATYNIAAGEVTPGSEYEFEAHLRVINTTTATNSVIRVLVNGSNVLPLTQANGTTAAAAPGAVVVLRGRITFASTTAAEGYIHFLKSAAVAANVVSGTSAPASVSVAGASTIVLDFAVSGTTASFICRQATIQRIK